METGYDILPFWVMRMLMMGQFLTGRLPFETVYLHGLIRDAKGDKMSKSKSNTINPLTVVEKYGADALRMALVIRSSAGLDKSISEADFKAARNLTNKLWNATRFVLMLAEESQNTLDKTEPLTKPLDKKFKQQLESTIKEISGQLNRQQIGLAAETIHNRFWHWFCDEAIEQAKNKQLSPQLLLEGLIVFLKLFHPFMPFITEQLWQELLNQKLVDSPLLITSPWPTL
jgi:valyl-tRNA synthetase